jgi:hypothetical protein
MDVIVRAWGMLHVCVQSSLHTRNVGEVNRDAEITSRNAGVIISASL